MSDIDQRQIAMVTVVALAVVALSQVPIPPVNKDPEVYLDAVVRMRAGAGYYPSMDAALRSAGIGPVQSARGFRSPWIFEVWSWLPGSRTVWILYVVGVLISATAAVLLTRHEAAAIAPTVMLIGVGLGAFMSVEPWATPWMLLALVCAHRGRDGAGALFGLMAVLVRELALPVLIGGLIWSTVHRQRRWPWMAAFVVAIGSFWLHGRWAAPFLVVPGKEAKLWASASWGSLPRLVGFGLPVGVVLGPLVAAAAWVQAVRRRIAPLVGPVLAFALIGLVVERPYWGAIVVPLHLVLAGDLVGDLWRQRRSARFPDETGQLAVGDRSLR